MLLRLAEFYAAGMVGTGLFTAIVDNWLFRSGRITRRVSKRGCLMMGALWPAFLFLMVLMLCKMDNSKR